MIYKVLFLASLILMVQTPVSAFPPPDDDRAPETTAGGATRT